MITEYILLLILILLAEILKRMSSGPLAPAGGGMLQPWQARELLNAQARVGNVGRWLQ